MDELDLDLDETLEADNRLLVGVPKSDKKICSCGHAISRHKHNPLKNRWECKPNAYRCPCLIPTPVLEVGNTRFFMRKSDGSGTKHALSRGYAVSKDKIKDFTESVEWLIPPQCQFCGEETKYYPVRVKTTGKLILDTEEDEGVTVFLCPKCRDPRTQAEIENSAN